MMAMPAVDVRDGACVQLVGGSYADEQVRLADPLRVARRWMEYGFRALHLVDLDAATGTGSNAALVDSIVREATAEVQVGGGVRSSARIEQLLGGGATRVVAGTRALEDGAWLAAQAIRFPNRIVAAVDVRGGNVSIRGWTTALLDRDVERCVDDVSALPLAGILVTAVDVEGRMRGPDLRLIERVIAVSRVPVIASGGIASLSDLRALAARGVSASVIGMALYTGRLDPRAVATEFGA